MKSIKKYLSITICMFMTVTTMAQKDYWEALAAVQPTDKVLGTITTRAFLNSYTFKYKNGYCDARTRQTTSVSEGGWDEYELSLSCIKNEAYFKYPSERGNFIVRDISYTRDDELKESNYTCDMYANYIKVTATIVVPGGLEEKESPKKTQEEPPLSKAIDKALIEVREGSRIAIDQIRVTTGIDKEDYKDEVVEILLDKGFKVVAKEYLEKLYEEQQNQQSGIYNDRTTVKENNFSAVGYYLNVRLTETALRVQVIDVSSGEYVGNVTVKLQ